MRPFPSSRRMSESLPSLRLSYEHQSPQSLLAAPDTLAVFAFGESEALNDPRFVRVPLPAPLGRAPRIASGDYLEHVKVRYS